MKFWSNWEELRILLRWKGFKGVKLTQVSHDNRSEVWGFLRKFQNLHSDQCMLLPCFVTVCDFWSCMIPNSKTTIDVLVVLNLKYISHMIYIKSLCVDMRQQLQLQLLREHSSCFHVHREKKLVDQSGFRCRLWLYLIQECAKQMKEESRVRTLCIFALKLKHSQGANPHTLKRRSTWPLVTLAIRLLPMPIAAMTHLAAMCWPSNNHRLPGPVTCFKYSSWECLLIFQNKARNWSSSDFTATNLLKQLLRWHLQAALHSSISIRRVDAPSQPHLSIKTCVAEQLKLPQRVQRMSAH